MNRRTFLKRMFYSTMTAVGLSGGTYVYAKYIEPALLTVKEQTIRSNYIPKAFNDFTIVQFSDTHIGFHYSLDQLQQLVKRINNLEPDLIVFTGDLVDDPDHYEWNNRLIEILQSLNAPYGKFWIYGNHDHGGYGTRVVKNTFDAAYFTMLQNSQMKIQKNDAYFYLIGVDDMVLGKPDLQAAIGQAKDEDFKILLSHAPDFADITRKYPVDVQLSGHSHGGQVRFPFVGHVYTPSYATKYINGMYTFDHERLFLYVNSGIGTTRLPFRFLCKPELTKFILQSGE